MDNVIKYVEGDLFDAPELTSSAPVIIAHVCNDEGAWSAGFVLPLTKFCEEARTAYFGWAEQRGKPFLLNKRVWYNSSGANLFDSIAPFRRGEVQYVEAAVQVIVANMVAQTLEDGRALRYTDLVECMTKVAYEAIGSRCLNGHPARIIAPMFGSGLAGGDWNFIEKLIEDAWINLNIPVTIYYLKKFLPDNWSPPKDN
tara:strand:- start:1290 stop:1886 length:597 start_codon:yes stop_codon:yes gene_type:complete